MKILKCPRCNRLFHIDKACYFCGNTNDNVLASQAEVHENAKSSFALAENLVSQGRFDEALSVLGEVLKWSPNSSEVHWLRLLARTRCRSDRELFFRGVCVSGLPDYDTAVRYASEIEKSVYKSVGNSCDVLKKTLLGMIKSHNLLKLKKLDLPKTLASMQTFVSEKRSTILGLWQELRKCEEELKLLENEGLYFIHECLNNMQEVRSSSAEIRGILENMDELDRKQFFMYKVKLESLKKTAESAKEEYYRLKSEHPSVKTFAGLCEKRDELKNAVNAGLEEIKAYEKKIEAVISQINSEKEEGENLLKAAESGSYEPIKNTIGQKNFEKALQYALAQK